MPLTPFQKEVMSVLASQRHEAAVSTWPLAD